jgi:predicted PurR-regulated permease PerM
LNQSSVDRQLADAITAIERAFDAVYAVEKTGGNTTNLVAYLNLASDLSTQAQMDLEFGNLTAAANKSDSIMIIAQQITQNAQAANEKSSTARKNQSIFIVTVTLAVEFVFCISMLLIWRKFRRRYVDYLSNAKPEVKSD